MNTQPNLRASSTAIVDAFRVSLEQLHGVGQVAVAKLRDNSGVLAVLPMRTDGKTNAQICNLSGEIRCEVEIPENFREGSGFADAYYINDELTAIFVRPGRDFAFVVEEKTGKVIRIYETR